MHMRGTLDKYKYTYTQCAFVNADYDCRRRPAHKVFRGVRIGEKPSKGASTLWTGNASRARSKNTRKKCRHLPRISSN